MNRKPYGREEHEWEKLTAAGLAFLIERARLPNTTTYTELRPSYGEPAYLALTSDRAAVGHLLGLIVERNYPTTGLMSV